MNLEKFGLIPLVNFGIITEGNDKTTVYRCAQPLFKYQYEWIKEHLGIKAIVNLRSEKNIDPRFCDTLGIKTLTIDVPDHHAPTLDQVKRFIEFIQKTDGPILIHCEHGHGRTSTFSVISKLVDGLNLEWAIEDEKNRFHYNFKHHAQEEFLRSLDVNELFAKKSDTEQTVKN